MEWETEEGEERMCKSLGRQAAGGQDTAGLTARKDMVPGGAAEQGSRAGQQLEPTVPETHCQDSLCLSVMENH